MSLPTVQDKIFTEYMNLRAAVKKVDGFIPVRTTFIQMEEKFLLWRRELEQLQGDVQKKDVDETAAGNIVPPIRPPPYPPSRSFALTSNKQAYITSRLNEPTRSGTYLMHLLKYALFHLPPSWTPGGTGHPTGPYHPTRDSL